MAGDWIKMRVGLATHPRVRRIAECLLAGREFLEWSGMRSDDVTRNATLRVTRYVAVTALLRFWGYANEHAKGERIDDIGPEDIDEVTGVPGFGAALDCAGWVVFDRSNGGLMMPNFEEHNVSATDRHSAAAERQKRYRERKKLDSQTPRSDVTRDVTDDVTVTPREEKRREDIKPSPIPPEGAKPKREKAFGFPDFIRRCREAGEKPIPDSHPVFAYAREAKIPDDFLALQWREFKDRYADGKKRYLDWRTVFSKSVRGNWFRLWYAAQDGGGYRLTTEGIQAQNKHKGAEA